RTGVVGNSEGPVEVLDTLAVVNEIGNGPRTEGRKFQIGRSPVARRPPFCRSANAREFPEVTLWRAGVTVPKSAGCARLSELLDVVIAWLCAGQA
ncbi:hypothetical protein P0D88_44875, partial [Paraburkholderia sp. RL18-103-BIB-C]